MGNEPVPMHWAVSISQLTPPETAILRWDAGQTQGEEPLRH